MGESPRCASPTLGRSRPPRPPHPRRRRRAMARSRRCRGGHRHYAQGEPHAHRPKTRHATGRPNRAVRRGRVRHRTAYRRAEAGEHRKTLATLAMILDFADAPLVGKDTRGHPVNAARDRTTVRLPREDRAELAPPTAEQYWPFTGRSLGSTGCRCSCSKRRGCGSENWKR